jgi:type IV pilus assembly protein PilY1
MLKRKQLLGLLATCVALVAAAPGVAQVVSEDFTGTYSPNNSNPWWYFNGACLTAGTSTSGPNPGTIPNCVSIASTYYNQTLVGGDLGYLGSASAPSSPGLGVSDPAGQGALRFTNGSPGGYAQNGAILSQNTFPTGAGVQVTFVSMTYRGNSGGGAHDGADGMSFFLMDGAQPPGLGAWGGSLGYTCSNSNPPYNGLVGGYIGLGIDEYGNFLNQGDNTASGWGYQPGRIGLRGAGNIAWSWLNANYPVQYPGTLTQAQQDAAVESTCRTGYLWDYSTPTAPVPYQVGGANQPVMDYPAIPSAYQVLNGVQIANEAAVTRGQATPIAYRLKITQDGLLSFSYSYNGGAYQSVITKQAITTSNGPLPGTFRFGFAGSTGGSTNVHEILCFVASPVNQAQTSVGVNQKDASKIATGTQAYLAYYYPYNWTGRLTANNLLYSAATNSVSVATTANWDGQCVLSGVAGGSSCPTTTAAGPTAAEGPLARTILTWNGTQGVSFHWNNLTAAQQNNLDLADTPPINDLRLRYLRGDRTNEVNSAGVGLFRARDGVLADIVDSSPTWVGPPSLPYGSTWQDALNSSAVAPENSGSQTYATYSTTGEGTRLNVVYAGANDGMVHGFRTGSYDLNHNYVNNLTTPNDGYEVLAYVPGGTLLSPATTCVTSNPTESAVQNIHGVQPANANCNPATATASVNSGLDYSSTQYGHNFFVDATPATGDLFYGGAWHSWLAGGLGAGGGALYVLDVTDPTTFSESNASSLVIGEWTAASINCANVANCGANLGNTYGQPVIVRLHNGGWAVIFGNGFASASGDAGIYIMTVDPVSMAQTFYYLSTGMAGNNDGIAYAFPADLDGDHIIDYVYAGDLLGNIWRFDLTSSNPANWTASSSPLFTTPGGQPITTKVEALIVPTTPPRVVVDFGTGQSTSLTNLTPQTYATGSQSLYGIWDWNMSSWNAMSALKFASLTAPQTINASGGSQNLVTQTAIPQGNGTLMGSTNPVCWMGSSTCSGGAAANNQFGWELALPGTAEQVIFNPIVYQGVFVVNTTIPATNSLTSCSTNSNTGNTFAINASTGAAVTNFFQNFTNDTNGVQTDGSGSPFFVNASGSSFMLTQTSGVTGAGVGGPGQACPAPLVLTNGVCSGQVNGLPPTGKRLTWIQKR